LKIVIITTGQPSTNPRMLKEVDALLSKDFEVKVLYSYWASWAFETDKKIIGQYPKNTFTEVGGNPFTAKTDYFLARIIQKTALKLGTVLPFLSDYPISRNSFFLTRIAKKQKADLFIAHNIGALPAAVKAAKKQNALCGFDAEDYHRGEYVKPEGVNYLLTKKLEDKYLSCCDYITAASPLIAKAYETIASKKKVTVIHNVFSKKNLQPIRQLLQNEGLKIFWFSQTTGPHRGLEFVINAINKLTQYNISLHLMGNVSVEYREQLENMSDKQNIFFLPPVSPDKIFSIAALYDIGLAAEVPCNDNRNLCLTNKLFTYLLAGNFILASDTFWYRGNI